MQHFTWTWKQPAWMHMRMQTVECMHMDSWPNANKWSFYSDIIPLLHMETLVTLLTK